MKPTDLIRSTQDLQNYMMALMATRDEVLDDSSDKTAEGVIYNMIEVLSDEATFSALKKYVPQDNEFAEEALMYELGKGVYFGYFTELELDNGIVRLLSW